MLEGIYVVDVTPIGEGLIAAYVVTGDNKVAVIDPGPSNGASKLISFLEDNGLEPDYIIPTHIHLDHGGASCTLSQRFPNSIILVHPKGAKHLVDPSKLWNASKSVLGPVAEAYGKPDPCKPDRVKETTDSSTIQLGDLTLNIIHTPGHASHHQSIWIPELGIMFTGDSAGVILPRENDKAYIPTTPPPFRPDLYIESIKKMLKLRPSYIAPTHYGIYADGTSYLEEHIKQIDIWVNKALELAKNGISDPDIFLREIKEIDENALFFLENENPIVQGSFIHTTAVGLMDYATRYYK